MIAPSVLVVVAATAAEVLIVAAGLVTATVLITGTVLVTRIVLSGVVPGVRVSLCLRRIGFTGTGSLSLSKDVKKNLLNF